MDEIKDVQPDDGNGAAQDAASQDPCGQLRRERDEYLDGWKRAKADLMNFKKDEGKRVEALAKMANENLVRDLLVVLDSFDLAIGSLGGESKVEKGIYMIRAQFEDTLRRYGLERVTVSAGQHFDPAVHEAVALVDSDQPPGTVVDEVERGYMLMGKLIRPARVKVAK
jgi:molecular chaperone GrpE